MSDHVHLYFREHPKYLFMCQKYPANLIHQLESPTIPYAVAANPRLLLFTDSVIACKEHMCLCYTHAQEGGMKTQIVPCW